MHTPPPHPVGLFGASGYAGIEATRLIAGHPSLSLAFATSDRWQGESLPHRTGLVGLLQGRRYVSLEEGLAAAAGCAVVLLATPAEASMELAPKLLAQGVKVVDLSGAFRLRDAAAYPKHYGFPHGHAGLLGEAVYGLPELNGPRIREARLVANPGCFATAVTLAYAPLRQAGLLQPGRLIADAASGVTGAGRKASEEHSFSEVSDDFRAYRTLRHQHTPEVTQTLEGLGTGKVSLTFTAHLLPIKRGILATCHATLRPGTTKEQVRAAYETAYAEAPFVRLLGSADEVQLKRVVGTNLCELGFALGEESDEGRVLLVTSAIDNLVKGASGQAIHNTNLLLGLEETAGLAALRGFHP